MLWKNLKSNDSLTLAMAQHTMNNITLSETDLSAIYVLLENDVTKDFSEESTSNILLREFQYTADQTTIPFIEKLFYLKKENRNYQAAILKTLSGMKSEASFHSFFKLAKDFPPSEQTEYIYSNIFNNFADTLALSRKYIPPLLGITKDISFRYYVYNFFTHGCSSDSSFVDSLEIHVPQLLKEATKIVDTYNLLEFKDSLPIFEEFHHLNRLNFILANYHPSKEIDEHFNRLKLLPNSRLLVNIIDALLIRGMEVPDASFEIVSQSPYQWNRLLENLDYEKNLSKIPSNLFTPERTVEAIAANVIEDKYDPMINYQLLETRTRSFQETNYRIFIFTFAVEGYEDRFLGICSQPTDEIQVKGNYFYYLTEPYIEENKEADIKRILAAWE